MTEKCNPDDVSKAIKSRDEAFNDLKEKFSIFVSKTQSVKTAIDFAAMKKGHQFSLLNDTALIEVESLSLGGDLLDLLRRYEYLEERLQRVLAGGELFTEEDMR